MQIHETGANCNPKSDPGLYQLSGQSSQQLGWLYRISDMLHILCLSLCLSQPILYHECPSRARAWEALCSNILCGFPMDFVNVIHTVITILHEHNHPLP